MANWAYKKILDRRFLSYRLCTYALIGIFILFFLLSTQTELSFRPAALINTNAEVNFCPPGPNIVVINYRSSQLTFIESIKNKRAFHSFYTPFDLFHRSADWYQNQPVNTTARLKNDSQSTCLLNILVLDLPPPSI
jgi:hypothetical protein